MTEKKIYKVPDISLAGFLIEIVDYEQNPIKGVEFSYVVDGSSSNSGTTNEQGILNVRPVPQNEVTISLREQLESPPRLEEEITGEDEEIDETTEIEEPISTDFTTIDFDTTTQNSLLKNGSTGDKVKLLQEKLNFYGANIKVDGIFGPLTDKAVRIFQEVNALKIDGIAGPNTWNALDNYKILEQKINDLMNEFIQTYQLKTNGRGFDV